MNAYSRFVILPESVLADEVPQGQQVFFSDMGTDELWKEASELLSFFPVGHVGILHGAEFDRPAWCGVVVAPSIVEGVTVSGMTFQQILKRLVTGGDS